MINTSQSDVNVTGMTSTQAAFLYAYIAVRIFLGLLAISGNSLTLAAITKFENLRNPTNNLIASLAAADVLGGCVSFFLLTTHLLQGSRLWVPICTIGETINLVSNNGNILNIFWITIDRYLYIVHPFTHSKLVTERNSLIVIAVTWVWVISLDVISVFATATTTRLQQGYPCRFAAMLPPKIFIGLHLSQVIIVTPVIIALYLRIAYTAWTLRHTITPINPNDQEETSSARQGWKITKMIGMVLGIFLLSVFCCTAILFANSLTSGGVLIFLDRSLSILWWTNCWTNPFIYAWQSKDIRNAFKKLLGLDSNSVGVVTSAPWWCFLHTRSRKTHDDVIKWKHFPRYWSFVRGIHRSPVNFPHKCQWRVALMFSLICTRINGWVKTVRLVIWHAIVRIMTSL